RRDRCRSRPGRRPLPRLAAGRLIHSGAVQPLPTMLTLVRADHAAVAALLFIPLTSASAHRLLVGQSVAGHRMVAFELGDPSSPRKDGYSAGTRQNAHGVDLNGKFPSAWRPLGGIYDSGPRALSKPENRFAYRLIVRVRPRTS